MTWDEKASQNLRECAAGRPAMYPGIKMRDLTTQTQERIGAHIIGMLGARDVTGRVDWTTGKPTDAEIYLAALDHFGVECPHPAPLGDVMVPSAWGMVPSGEGGTCKMCGALIVRDKRGKR